MTDKVDEAIKGDIIHWAAFYVRPCFLPALRNYILTGGSNACRAEEDIPSGSMGDQGHGVDQGASPGRK